MPIQRPPIDKWYFSGDEEMNTTFASLAADDKTSDYPNIYRTGVVRLGATDHGYKAAANPEDRPNNIFIQGTTNYDGLRQIVAVATDTLDIVAKYVAENPNGQTLRPGFQFDWDVEFIGFKLHLDTASATATENLVCSVDADKGAAWDVNIYTKDMNTERDIINIFSKPIPIGAKDRVYFTWANASNRLWGLEILTRKIM